MNPTTQLAMMTKAQQIFETDGTFLSFPVLSPLVYPEEKLLFQGTNTDLGTLGEFSRLVNQIPRGPLFQPGEDCLWDLYAKLFHNAIVASDPETTEHDDAYLRARELLYVIDPDGVRRDGPVYLSFKQYRDAWISAREAYKSAQLTAAASSDPELKLHWQTVDEPALRQAIAEMETDWLLHGRRDEVEAAERVIREYAARSSSAIRMWEEWRDAYNPDVDSLVDPVSNQTFAPTSFCPVDPFQATWPVFSLSKDEVGKLVNEASPELKDTLDLSISGQEVDSVSFEFRSVTLNRPWLRSDVFRARFWRLPSSEPVLSTGELPLQGSCPAYICGVVFARGIIEVTRQTGGSIDHRSVPVMPALNVLRPVVVPPPRLVKLPPALFGIFRPTKRVVPTDIASSPSASMLPSKPDSEIKHINTATLGAALNRLRMNSFETRPDLSRGAPGNVDSVSPSPQTHTLDSGSKNITILAFICRRLPKCPDPDPALAWT